MTIAAFTHALQTIPGAPPRGILRSGGPAQYIAAPLSALGSKINGGRYNAGTFEVYHLAPNADVALRETQAVDPSGVPKRIAPLTLFTIDADLQLVVDLMNNDTLRALGETATDLTTEWRAVTLTGSRQSRTRSGRPHAQPISKR